MQPWTVLAIASDQILQQLVGAGIIAIVASVISSLITGRILGERSKNLDTGLVDLSKQVRQILIDMGKLRGDQVDLEKDCRRTYATRDDLIAVIGESAANARELANEMKSVAVEFRAAIRELYGRMDSVAEKGRESVSKVHGRLDGVERSIARLEALVGEKSQ